MHPVPDPIHPEKFLGYSRESNPGPFGWKSDVLTTIPNRRASNLIKIKLSPLQAMKTHRGCGCMGPHIGYMVTALGRGRGWIILLSTPLPLGKAISTHFILG